MGEPRPESTVGALLTLLPPCSQCGQRFYDRACGPTHAMIAANPLRHRVFDDLVRPLCDESKARAVERNRFPNM